MEKQVRAHIYRSISRFLPISKEPINDFACEIENPITDAQFVFAHEYPDPDIRFFAASIYIIIIVIMY